MTICVGILSGDGIVIAADTEESAGDSKRDQQKLLSFTSGLPHTGASTPPPTTAILTGAGDAGYLDAFFYLLSKDAGSCSTMAQFEQYMSEEVRLFHEKHIFPSCGRHRRDIDILAAVSCGWDIALFVSSGSTLRKALFNTAIGFGQPFAQNLLNQRPAWCQTLQEAQLLAAYVVYATKSQVQYCGLHTSISTLHTSVSTSDLNGSPSFRQPRCLIEVGFDQTILREWEDSFDTKWKTRQKALFADLLAEELQATKQSDPQS